MGKDEIMLRERKPGRGSGGPRRASWLPWASSIALLLMFLTGTISSANPPRTRETKWEAPRSSLSLKGSSDAESRFAKPGEGLEAAISADSYRLGPGDSLTIGVWALQPVQYDVGVNVEGRLIIPGVAELQVDGLFLEEARELIKQAVLRSFHDAEITVSLRGLRRFLVHVLGQVERPGTYIGTATDRVSAAVGWAGGFMPYASQRRVSIMCGDSLRARADLFGFLRRGIASCNPQLRDGDIIYVPYAHQRFTIRGAVNEPAEFEFLEGDRFSDAISYAGGFTPEVFADTIEVARYLGPDRHPVRFFVIAGGGLVTARSQDEPYVPRALARFTVQEGNLAPEDRSDYADFLLQPEDVIFIRSIPEYRVKRLIEIVGEVVYPGFYAITEGETRLSDVITRAGGITPEAFLIEATLIRSEAIHLEDKEFERLKKIPPADMTEDEYEYFKLRSRENRGLMVVDFSELLVEGDTGQDLLLRGGDVITIPKRRDFVSVLGMVRSPGNILYEPGRSPKDFIEEAGGYAEKADRGKTRIIKASTAEWVSLGDVEEVEPGDTIWIPEKPERHYWQVVKEIILVATQIVTIYLVVDTAVNN
ncbi:MAG: SLBB domain-containing protein [Candidatus Eisenbacteria sp.]|nr:SLBB domain-containing protein [Candidatus Eisenbacteria bacterium]